LQRSGSGFGGWCHGGHDAADAVRIKEADAMTPFVISLIVVIAVLAGGLIGLLRGRRLPPPPQDVLDRVRQRERELEAKEKLERDE
jgi:hypothetical protein